jgi:hypothetical protein
MAFPDGLLSLPPVFSLVNQNDSPPESITEYYLTTKKRRAVKPRGLFSNG